MTPAILHCVPGALYRADIADQHSRLADALHGANNTDTAFRTLLNERVPGGQPITAADVLYGVYQHGGRIVLQPHVLQDLLQHAQEPRSPHAAGAHQLLALATQLSMLHATHCADGSRALKLEALQESGQLLNNLARYFLGKSANEVSVPGFVINDDSHGVVDRLKGVVNGALQRCAGDIGEQLIERISKPVALANLERWENDHPGELPDNERAFAIAVKGKGSEAAMSLLAEQLKREVAHLNSDTLAYLIRHTISQVDLPDETPPSSATPPPSPGSDPGLDDWPGAERKGMGPWLPGMWPPIVNRNHMEAPTITVPANTGNTGNGDAGAIASIMGKLCELIMANETRHNDQITGLMRELLRSVGNVQAPDTQPPARRSMGTMTDDKVRSRSDSDTGFETDEAADDDTPPSSLGTQPIHLPRVTLDLDTQRSRNDVPEARRSDAAVLVKHLQTLGLDRFSRKAAADDAPDLRPDTTPIKRQLRFDDKPPARLTPAVSSDESDSDSDDDRAPSVQPASNAAAPIPPAAVKPGPLPLTPVPPMPVLNVDYRVQPGALTLARPGSGDNTHAVKAFLAQLASKLEQIHVRRADDSPIALVRKELRQGRSPDGGMSEAARLAYEHIVQSSALFKRHHDQVFNHLRDIGVKVVGWQDYQRYDGIDEGVPVLGLNTAQLPQAANVNRVFTTIDTLHGGSIGSSRRAEA